jgi:predicted RNA binding protein YcfA (HicA-like mRNA interferase family)
MLHSLQRFTAFSLGTITQGVKEKGSIRYYGKPGVNRLVRVDYHGAKEVPTGTCYAILKAAGLRGKNDRL